MPRSCVMLVGAWSMVLLGCDNPLPPRTSDAGVVETIRGAAGPRELDASVRSGAEGGASGQGDNGASEPDASVHAGAEGGAGSVAAGQGAAGAAGRADVPAVVPEIERATVVADASSEISDADYLKLIKQLNQFGLELGRRHVEGHALTGHNSIYSPLSAAVALSMTYAGARGVTAAELNEVLAGGIAPDVFHAGVDRLIRELKSLEQVITSAGSTRRIELNVTDALYIDKSLAVERAFLEALARHYDTGVYREDFVSAPEPARVRINDWVSELTHERITGLIPKDKIRETTRFVIVNALYFYGSWAFPFELSATRDADFHTLDGSTVLVPTMHQQESMRYVAGSGFVAVELPYLGHALRMAIVLPDAGNFEAIRSGLSADWLDATLSSMTVARVSLALPKFTMTSDSFLLNDALIDMGLSTAFSVDADLSGITLDEPLRIVDVVQKAFIAVDEFGTEAAAATAVVGGFSTPLGDPIELAVDRPFLFVVCDGRGVVLFNGQVVHPGAP